MIDGPRFIIGLTLIPAQDKDGFYRIINCKEAQPLTAFVILIFQTSVTHLAPIFFLKKP